MDVGDVVAYCRGVNWLTIISDGRRIRLFLPEGVTLDGPYDSSSYSLTPTERTLDVAFLRV